MAALKTVFIAGVLLIAGLIAQQGLGNEFGVLQEVNNFEDQFPDPANCNWNETGSYDNVEITGDCQLAITNTSISHSEVNVDRYRVNTKSEWENGYSSDNRIIYNSSTQFVDDNYQGYIAPSQDGKTSEYFSNEFYLDNETLYVNYRYQERTAPNSITLELYDGSVQDSVTLQPGSGNEDFLQTAALEPVASGQHELRITIDGADRDDQRIYELYGYQNSSEIQGVSSGLYQADARRAGEQMFLDRIEYQGQDTTDLGTSNQKTIELIFYGYDGGSVVETERYYVSNNIEIEQQNIFDNDAVDSYSFDALFVSEDSVSPKLNYVYAEGGLYNRTFASLPSQWVRALVMMIFIGMALAYAAKAI